MKKKYMLIILLSIFFVGNSNVYANEYCDKLSEYKEYTNLCRYEFLDGTFPITANLYIGPNGTMIEWTCSLRPRLTYSGSSGDICDGKTKQRIKSNEGEKTFEGSRVLWGIYKDTYHFNNYINSASSCPNYIYYYDGSIGKTGGGFDVYANWAPSQEEQYGLSGFLATGYWTKLEITRDCSNAVVEPEPEEPDDISCDLIDKEIIDTLNEVMTYIRIGIPILLIGLIIFDFASAMFASSEDKMKKAQSKAIKRVIIAIIIFLVPTLINLILNIANDVWSNANFETCGLK